MNVSICLLFSQLIFFSCFIVSGEDIQLKYNSKVEEKLIKSFLKNETPNLDTLTSWLVAEGNNDSLSIYDIRQNYNILLNNIKIQIDIDDDADDKAEDIFDYLHDKIFKRYLAEANFKQLFSEGSFNALTGNAIYYLICRHYKIPIEIIYSPYYLYTRINFNDESIDIEIMDKLDGFDKDMNKGAMLQFLVNLNIINTYEYQNENEDLLFDKYFGGLTPIDPYKFTAALYNVRGSKFLQLGNLEEALKYFEKAVIIDQNNNHHLDNYKYALYNLNDMISPYDSFIPYLKNSFWILSDDPTFVDVAILMSNKAILYYADELRNHRKALKIIRSLKTRYLNEKYLKVINEQELQVRYNWANYFYKNGQNYLAYTKMKEIYFEDKTIPKYKEGYVDFTVSYVTKLLKMREDIDKARGVMDTLYSEAPDYYRVKDLYVNVLLFPIHNYMNSNLNKAKYIAHKVFKKFPNHEYVQFFISQVYHELALQQLRKNNMKEAYKILVNGLKYLPNDKLLNETFEELEKM